MKKLFAITLLALGLAGCAEIHKVETTLSNAIGVVASTKINSKSAYIAINVFNAAERSVTTYLRLPPCDGKIPVCRVSGAAAALDRPFNAGIVARNQLRAFMRANPGTLADAGLYNTLVQATGSLQAIMDVYGVGKAR